MRPVILGTAGHIDHGKTTLVRALTGINTDRLPEEKARGITIELGFAHLDAGGRRFGIVDVPGHERFVRTMVAGAGGVDVVMLVIAADEGVMPQTLEHLDVCRLLDVDQGLVVLTKTDMIDDADWLSLVRDDVRAALAGTFLKEAPIIDFAVPPRGDPVGVEALTAALLEAAEAIDDRPAEGAFRLPVDRIFTIQGFGTVVTGTLLSGSVAVGDSIELLPSGASAKVRGIEVHGDQVAQAEAGQRTAINLQGVDRDQLERGDMAVATGTLRTTHMVDVTVRYLGHLERPLKHRAKVLFHLGTATARGTVALLDRQELLPGEEGLAQVRLDRAVVALPGDRFILRGFAKTSTHGRTIGGGRILDNNPRRHRASDTGAAALVANLVDTDAGGHAEAVLKAAGPVGLDREALLARTGLAGKRLAALVTGLLGKGTAVRYDKERDALIHGEVLAELEARAGGLLLAFHEENPRRRGMAREELRSRLGGADEPRLFHLLLQRLQKAGTVVVDRELVRRADFRARDDEKLESVKGAVLSRYRSEGTTPPRSRDLPGLLGEDEATVLPAVGELVEEGALVRIHEDIYMASEALTDLRERLLAHLEEHGSIDAAGYKEIVRGSRKFAIPVAEHFDKEKLTMRVGDTRVLRKRR